VTTSERDTGAARRLSDARTSFDAISTALFSAVEDTAPPPAAMSAGAGRVEGAVRREGALLTVSRLVPTPLWTGPFDVAAHAEVSISLDRPDRTGWEGRTHSLWYCDASGAFGWHELAFRHDSLRPLPPVEPYALAPAEATVVFEGTMGVELAWPVESLNTDVFVGRWLGWFVAAARDELRRPSMPEKPITQKWPR
jgi:serine/threonine-protein kinase